MSLHTSRRLLSACFLYLKHRANHLNEWRDMIWCLRGIGYDRECAHEFARLSDQYDSEGVDLVWDNYNNQKWSWLTLFQWLKSDLDEKTYREFCELYLIDAPGSELALEGDWGLSKLFTRAISHHLRLTNEKGYGYFYNQESRLWKSFYPQFLCNVISETLRPILKKIIQEAVDIDAVKDSELASLYKPILKKILSSSGANKVAKQAIKDLVDPSFHPLTNSSTELLPIKNGKVLNLKTLEVRDRVAEDYFTAECPVDYIKKESYSVAEEFFLSLCSRDQEYAQYLRRLLAYFLTGETTDRHFYIFLGPGRNGKSTLISLMELILQNFYKSLSDSVMTTQAKKSICTPELLPLVTARLGVLPEMKEADHLYAKRIKTITSQDSIVCRPLYSNEFQFASRTKLVMMTNHLPKFDASDKAMVDRIIVLPFREVFDHDPKYKSMLLDHIDEIFSYIVDAGAEFWDTKKVLRLPTIIKEQTNSYVEQNDIVRDFILECCEVKEDTKTQAAELYKKFKDWTEKNQFAGLDSNKFFGILEKKFKKSRTKSCIVYNGIRLL